MFKLFPVVEWIEVFKDQLQDYFKQQVLQWNETILEQGNLQSRLNTIFFLSYQRDDKCVSFQEFYLILFNFSVITSDSGSVLMQVFGREVVYIYNLNATLKLYFIFTLLFF